MINLLNSNHSSTKSFLRNRGGYSHASNLKSIAVIAMMLLSIGVGNVWGDSKLCQSSYTGSIGSLGSKTVNVSVGTIGTNMYRIVFESDFAMTGSETYVSTSENSNLKIEDATMTKLNDGKLIYFDMPSTSAPTFKNDIMVKTSEGNYTLSGTTYSDVNWSQTRAECATLAGECTYTTNELILKVTTDGMVSTFELSHSSSNIINVNNVNPVNLNNGSTSDLTNTGWTISDGKATKSITWSALPTNNIITRVDIYANITGPSEKGGTFENVDISCAASGSGGEESSSEGNFDCSGHTFYFANNYWKYSGNTYAHMYKAGGSPTTTWPGTAMTLVPGAIGVFSATYDNDEFEKVIFNENNDGTKLGEKNIEDCKYYDNNGISHDNLSDVARHIYFVRNGNAASWTPYAYLWYDTRNNGSGQALTNMSITNIDGHNLYSTIIPFYNNIKFKHKDNWTNESAGTYVDNSFKDYSIFNYADNKWYQTQNIYLAGTMVTPEGDWDDDDENYKFSDWDQESTYVTLLTPSLSASTTYNFKLVTDGTWRTANASPARTYTTDGTTRKFDETGGSDNNSSLTTDVAGRYYFKYDVSAGKLTITYPPYMTSASLNSKTATTAVISVESTRGTKYKVTNSDGSVEYTVSNGGAPTDGNITVTGLSANTQYSFKVYALDDNDTESANYSSVSSFYTLPNMGSASAATCTCNSITLNVSSTGGVKYTVTSTNGATTYLDKGTPSDGKITVSGLSVGTSYNFYVYAVNSANDLSTNYASVSSVSTTSLPATPSSISINTRTYNSITLNVTSANSTKFEYSTNAGEDWKTINTTGTIEITELSSESTALSPNTSYTFRIRGKNDCGDVSAGNAEFTAKTTPQMTSASYSSKTSNSVVLSVSSSGGSTYKVTNTAGDVIYTVSNSGAPTDGKITITGLSGYTNYTFRVYAMSSDATPIQSSNYVDVSNVRTNLGAPTAPSLAACKVVNVYSTTYDSEQPSMASFDNWGSSNSYTTETIDGTSMIKVTVSGDNRAYFGLPLMDGESETYVDASEMKKLHVDIWALNSDAGAHIYPVKGTGSPKEDDTYRYDIGLTGETWNSFDIELKDFYYYTNSATKIGADGVADFFVHIFQFKIDGLSGSQTNTLYITNLYFYDEDADCTVRHSVTMANDGNGSADADEDEYEEGATVTLTATPSLGYAFSSWTITKNADGSDVTSSISLSGQTKSATFTMPDYDVTVTATFEERAVISTPTVEAAESVYEDDPIDISLETTTYQYSNPVVVFFVSDGTTTYEVTGAPYGSAGNSLGSIGAAGVDYQTVHKATFTANAAATYTVTAKLYEGLLVDNYESSDIISGAWETVDGGTSSKVVNPNKQQNNGSNYVRSVTSNNENWKTYLYRFTSGITAYRYAHLHVYSSEASAPTLKMNDSKGDRSTGSSHSTNTWERLTYDEENSSTYPINFIFLFPTAASTTIYFDDVILSNESSMSVKATSSSASTTIALPTYTVTYDGNGEGVSGSVESEEYTKGSDVTVNSNYGGFTRTNYEFIGWNTEADGSGTHYDYWDIDNNEIKSISSNVTLYAEWKMIISSDNTDFAGYDDPTEYKDVVVRNGATLTITKATEIRDITIETGSTLNVNTTNGDGTGSGVTFTANSLSLKGGWGRVGGETKYDMPRVYIDPASTLTKTSNIVNFDIAVDNDNYYPFALPFDVPLKIVPSTTHNEDPYIVDYANSTMAYYSKYYSNESSKWQYAIKTYNGQSRANYGGSSDNWVHVAAGTTLKAGRGYALTALPASGYGDYAVIRFPMVVDNDWTTAGELGHYSTYIKDTVHVTAYKKEGTGEGTGDQTKKANIGWNLLGVPYMSCYTTSDGMYDDDNVTSPATLINGKLNITAGTYSEDEIPYVTVPVHDFSEYVQASLDEAVLLPGWCFFVQVATTGNLTFLSASEAASSSLPIYAPQREQEHKPTVKTGIILSGADASDKTTILVSDKYDGTEYEINADLEKMFGENSYTLATYSLMGETRLAYNAMSNSDATNVIPIGYRAPADGEYTFAINPRYAENGAFEHVNLIDYETGFVTDLLLSSYSFATERTQNDTRFALNVVKRQDVITDIGNGEEANGERTNGPQKVIINDKLYIIVEGKMYDAKGIMVK